MHPFYRKRKNNNFHFALCAKSVLSNLLGTRTKSRGKTFPGHIVSNIYIFYFRLIKDGGFQTAARAGRNVALTKRK